MIPFSQPAKRSKINALNDQMFDSAALLSDSRSFLKPVFIQRANSCNDWCCSCANFIFCRFLSSSFSSLFCSSSPRVCSTLSTLRLSVFSVAVGGGTTRGWWETNNSKEPSEVTYLQSRRSPPRPPRTLPLLLLTSFGLMFQRAFIPQILCALMNNAWASVANRPASLYSFQRTQTLCLVPLMHTSPTDGLAQVISSLDAG